MAYNYIFIMTLRLYYDLIYRANLNCHKGYNHLFSIKLMLILDMSLMTLQQMKNCSFFMLKGYTVFT